MLFGSTKVIGLDIGTSSVKVAELSLSARGAELVSFGFAPLAPGSMAAGEILDPMAVSEVIASLVQQIKTKRTKAATGIWGNSVIVKRISVPAMDPKLLKEQIRWEAEQYIPFDSSEVSIDYHLIQGSKKSDTMDVLLVAAKNDTVFRYAEVLENATLSCSVIDVNSFALANIYEFNYGTKSRSIVGLLNIGAAATNFVVVDNGKAVFVRDIPIGGINFTQDLHNNLGISLDEAESLKISAGTGQEVPEEVFSIISATYDGMMEEIQRSIDFYLASSNGGEIERFYISGGSVALPGLVDFLSRSMDRPVDILNPFKKVSYNKKKFSPEYIAQISNYVPIVLGLALRRG